MAVSVRTTRLKRRSVSTRDLQRRAEAMLRHLRLPQAELSILLCDDSMIRHLNRDYRGKDRPTDVLAFAMGEGLGAEIAKNLLGDVVISLPMARAQAAEHDRSIVDEVTFLLAHGLLHLLGYDHQTEGEAKRMNAKTAEVLAAVTRYRRRS